MTHVFEMIRTAKALYTSLPIFTHIYNTLQLDKEEKATNIELSRATQCCYEAESTYIYA